MPIRVHDSTTQTTVDFTPLVGGEVGMYVCGPTVQSSPHIGHLRSALVYDLWRRWFTYRGLEVTLVRNVTDIDDKILINASTGSAQAASTGSAQAASTGSAQAASTGSAQSRKEEWWALAYRFELEFTNSYNRLGILPPTYEPRATASVGEMQNIIAKLIERGHAYPAPDGSGDVYFDTLSWPSYGALTNQSPENMEAATDADPRGKRDPRDFALWKGHKEGEPESASWPSPWGDGRPGWHIECSAMSKRYLGDTFDIHGGGLDLRFPHHENELAQSTAAGDGFARYWMHNGLVNVGGQKMSKSLGNSIFAHEFLDLARPVVVRYYLAGAHYRSTIDYHDGALVEADAAFERIEGFIARASRRVDAGTPLVPEAFGAAMDDDLSVPQALAVLHDTVRAGNAALDADQLDLASLHLGEVLAMVGVLGVDPRSPQWSATTDDAASSALSALVTRLIADRERARKERDFTAADRIRDELVAAGISIEDTPMGTHWSIES